MGYIEIGQCLGHFGPGHVKRRLVAPIHHSDEFTERLSRQHLKNVETTAAVTWTLGYEGEADAICGGKGHEAARHDFRAPRVRWLLRWEQGPDGSLLHPNAAVHEIAIKERGCGSTNRAGIKAHSAGLDAGRDEAAHILV